MPSRPSAMIFCVLSLVVSAASCRDGGRQSQKYVSNGNSFFDERRFQEAIVEYRNALRIDGRQGEVRARLAEAYFTTGQAENALAEYVQAADLLPDRADLQIKAGNLLLQAERYEDAKSRADLALRKNSTDIDALMLRANAMAGLKDVAGAITDIENAVNTSEDGRLYANLAALRTIAGDTVEAEATFKHAIQLSPKAAEPRVALAVMYLGARRAAEAEAALRDAIAVDPRSVVANRLWAAFLISAGRPAEAEEPLKRLDQELGGRRRKSCWRTFTCRWDVTVTRRPSSRRCRQRARAGPSVCGWRESSMSLEIVSTRKRCWRRRSPRSLETPWLLRRCPNGSCEIAMWRTP